MVERHGYNMKLAQTLNILLVTIFHDVLDIERKFLITDKFKDITVNDIHVIEAIGLHASRQSSFVAGRLEVTMGTLTKAIDGLTAKGYVNRRRSMEDKRVVLLSLTKKGEEAYHHHAVFHKNLVQAVIEQLNEEEQRIFTKALGGLIKYLKSL